MKPSARALVLLLGLTGCLLSPGCAGGNGSSSSATALREEALTRVDACEAVLENLRALDVDNAPEPVLQQGLEDAILAYPTCREHYEAAARTDGERYLLLHRAEQIHLTALLLEAQLSARFDGGAHRCEILRESFVLLYGGVSWLESALAEGNLTTPERLRIVELRNLDLQAIDVLFLDFRSTCGSEPLQVE